AARPAGGALMPATGRVEGRNRGLKIVWGCGQASVSGTVVRDGTRSRCATIAPTFRCCSLLPHRAAHAEAQRPPGDARGGRRDICEIMLSDPRPPTGDR